MAAVSSMCDYDSSDNSVETPSVVNSKSDGHLTNKDDKSKFIRNTFRNYSKGPSKSKSSSYLQELGKNISPIIIKSYVKNINLEYVKPQRAGVIVYTVVNNAIYFGLGVDSKTHDLTDFGGGVLYDIDGNAIIGAMREFHEETLEIFDKITPEDIKNCPVLYDEHNLIIFVHIDVNPDEVSKNFNIKYKAIVEENNRLKVENKNNIDKDKPMHKIYYPEVCAITWLSLKDFQLIIKKEGTLFVRVRRFLNNADDFYYLL